MARTALFDGLKRALRLADVAESTGTSTSEIGERRAEALSRRAMLTRMGALAGGAAMVHALPGCADAGLDADDLASTSEALKTNARIVIVGAGLAGLTCAYRLSQRGVSARVFDANDRVGGRAFTLRSPRFPSKVELGGELIDSGHTNIQALVKELGLTLVDVAAATEGLEVERYFIGNRRYTESEIIEQFRPVARLLRRDFRSIGNPTYASYSDFTPRGRELDWLSIREWLDLNGVGGPIRTLLDIGYTAEYGLEIEEQSFLNLLYLIGLDPDPFLIYGESDERYSLQEGTDALAKAMAAKLPTEVQLGHRLEAVRTRRDGTLTVTFRCGLSTIDVVADKLVLAIPFNQLRKTDWSFPVSTAKRLAISELRYATNSKLMAATSSRPWVAAGSSGTSFNDCVYHESWDSSRGFPVPGGVITEFNGGRFGLAMGTGTPDFQARRFLDRLDLVYPGVRAAYTGQSARMHWPTARFFEGSYACYGPGDYTTFVGSEGEVEGNVHFCGEHTSSEAQGYLEGAVESGNRVAKELRMALRGARAA